MIPINTIIQGDCLEKLKELDDNSVDAIITDPPYNTGMIKKDLKDKVKRPWLFNFFNDSYTKEDYFNLVDNCSKNFFRVLKENRAIYIYMNWKSLGLWIERLENAGFKVKNVIIWDKVIHGLNYQNYANTYEMIIFGVKGDFFPDNKKDYMGKYYKDVWNIRRNIDNKDSDHETVKLLKVVELPILHSTKEGDIILDPFMGSGTTAVACIKNNRNFIGYEIIKEYIDIANEKISKISKQNKLSLFDFK